MPDFRALGRPAAPEAQRILLDREESHHLVVVNRATVGAEVVVFDGAGGEWLCQLETASKHAASLRILEKREPIALAFQITLAQALPKGTAMDGIVRKATEIGVRRIIPLCTARTQVHFDEGREDKKREKWETAAVEAAKQCGNPWVPDVQPVTDWRTFLTQLAPYDLRLVASLHPGTTDITSAWHRFEQTEGRLPRHALWLIGPEGDLTPEEVKTAVDLGFMPITLGPLVLRCETAATYALSVLSHTWSYAAKVRPSKQGM